MNNNHIGRDLVMKFLKNKKLIIIIVLICLALYIIIPRVQGYMMIKMQQQMSRMPVKVEVVTPKYEEINQQFTSSGRLSAEYNVEIIARIQGWLQKSYFKEGDYVKKGALLFLIDPREYQIVVQKAKAAVEQTKANLINAEKNLTRAAELIKQDFVSRSYYDEALAQRDSLKGSLAVQQAALADAKLNLSYTQIKAPVTGKIGNLIITEGNLVNTQSGPIATLISTDPIYANFTLKSDEYMAFKRNASKESSGLDMMRVSLILSDGTTYPETTNVDFVDNEVDVTAGTINLRATFNNKNNILVPGDYINVIVKSTIPSKVLLVPQEAVQESAEGMYVARVKEDNTVEQVFIKTSGQHDGQWIVTEGLDENMKVITKGLQKVRVGGPVEIVQAENSEPKK